MKKDIQGLKLIYLMDIFKRKTNEKHGMNAKELIGELEALGIHIERKTL